jgi:hypothetical protein
VDAYPGIHVNATHGTLGSQLLCNNRKVADHVGAGGLVINCGSVHLVFPEKIVAEGQVSQHDHDATLQGEASIRIPSLRKLSLQVSQGIEMGAEFGDENSRPVEPGR